MVEQAETTEERDKRLSTGSWITVDSAGWAAGTMPKEHLLRNPRALATRCSIPLGGRTVQPADGSRPPCRSCLVSSRTAEQYLQLPEPKHDGTLARVIAERDRAIADRQALAEIVAEVRARATSWQVWGEGYQRQLEEFGKELRHQREQRHKLERLALELADRHDEATGGPTSITEQIRALGYGSPKKVNDAPDQG